MGKPTPRPLGGRIFCGVDLIVINKQKAEVRKHLSKVVSQHLWNTPPNLFQQAIMKGFLAIVGQGDFLGCALGVCCNFRGSLETLFGDFMKNER